MFLNCSTCFERHTAHHQELKNCNYNLWFYIRLWLLAAVIAEWAEFIIPVFLIIAQHVPGDTPLIVRSSETVIATSGFTYVCGYWQLSWLSHGSCRQPWTYVKPEATITVFELLAMSGVSLETCWAIKKHWNNKFYYTVASCWLFLYDL
jgi:hypothetical protein